MPKKHLEPTSPRLIGWSTAPTYSPLTNDACAEHGHISKGLDKLPTLPTISLQLNSLSIDEDALAYEIECRNVQERPPYETFNDIKSPFIPLIPKSNENSKKVNLEDPIRNAYVTTCQYQFWKKKLSTTNLSKRIYKNVKKDCSDLEETGMKHLKRNYRIKETVTKLEECPIGPTNLYSSSCLTQIDQETFAFCDHTSRVTLCQLENNKQFFVRKHLRDHHLGAFSRGFGVKYDEENRLIALRQQDGIAVFDNNSISSRILNQESFCDMAFLSSLDSLIAIDVNGDIVLHDWQAKKELRSFSPTFCEDVKPFHWAGLENHSMSVFLSRVITRETVALFDVRKKAKVSKVFQCTEGEHLGGMKASAHSDYQFYASTSMKTILLDERYSKVPMTVWFHPNFSMSAKIPIGVAVFYEPDARFEYVATYWQDSDVGLICNDWKHSICPQRLDSDDNVTLSCQKGKEIIYPLSRGKPVNVPGVKYVLNELSMESDYTRQRLSMPWTGLTMFEENKELKLVAVNAVGDLFEAVINHEVINDDDDFDSQDPFGEMDISTQKSFCDTSSRGDDLLWAQHIDLPADTYQPNWLKYKPVSREQKDQINIWERSLPKFQKASFVTELYQREALPKSGLLAHNIKQLRLKSQVAVRRKETATDLNCPICGKLFAYKRGMDRHVKVIHEKDETVLKFVCDKCDFRTDQTFHLKHHKARMHKEENECTICKLMFDLTEDLKLHVENEHEDKSVCELCKKIMLAASLPKHKRNIHEKVQAYKCEFCEYTTGHNSTLGLHLAKIHQKPSRDAPYQVLPTCQNLKNPKDADDFGDETAEVVRIFEDRPLVLSEYETSETGGDTTTDDEDDETKSMRARQRSLKRKKSLTPGLPEDTTYTMEQFLQGLDPDMTSTQQSQFETTRTRPAEAESFTRVSDLEKTSLHDSMSKTSSKKKKKRKKATMGF